MTEESGSEENLVDIRLSESHDDTHLTLPDHILFTSIIANNSFPFFTFILCMLSVICSPPPKIMIRQSVSLSYDNYSNIHSFGTKLSNFTLFNRGIYVGLKFKNLQGINSENVSGLILVELTGVDNIKRNQRKTFRALPFKQLNESSESSEIRFINHNKADFTDINLSFIFDGDVPSRECDVLWVYYNSHFIILYVFVKIVSIAISLYYIFKFVFISEDKCTERTLISILHVFTILYIDPLDIMNLFIHSSNSRFYSSLFKRLYIFYLLNFIMNIFASHIKQDSEMMSVKRIISVTIGLLLAVVLPVFAYFEDSTIKSTMSAYIKSYEVYQIVLYALVYSVYMLALIMFIYSAYSTSDAAERTKLMFYSTSSIVHLITLTVFYVLRELTTLVRDHTSDYFIQIALVTSYAYLLEVGYDIINRNDKAWEQYRTIDESKWEPN